MEEYEICTICGRGYSRADMVWHADGLICPSDIALLSLSPRDCISCGQRWGEPLWCGESGDMIALLTGHVGRGGAETASRSKEFDEDNREVCFRTGN